MSVLLIVDDEKSLLTAIALHFQDNPDYKVITAASCKEAFTMLHENEIDLVITDLMLPDLQDGLAVMHEAKKQWYDPFVLAITGFETIENAVKAMQAGADDFMSKDFGLDELTFRIKNLLAQKETVSRLSFENRLLKETIQNHFSGYNIVGNSSAMHRLLNKIKKVAEDARATCLIQGESGTGKDLIARTIHAISKRREAPFIPINCAAIPENLIESELFGHEKGSFTGATITKQGKFEFANGGVIFLDEIGELPITMQTRLLRVLEERSFFRIGGNRPIHIDVLIISATNQDIQLKINEGKFREDLFYRLNVINLWIPPLREHKEDIRPLAEFFIEKFNKERNKQIRLSEQALQMLEIYPFKGNVRELRNVLEDAYVFCEKQVILPENLKISKLYETDLPKAANTLDPLYQLTHKKALEQFEKLYFQTLLHKNDGNITRTAAQAAISREWLSKKIKTMGIKCES
jgi:two-component system nitrogen regulation response regulator NtrX